MIDLLSYDTTCLTEEGQQSVLKMQAAGGVSILERIEDAVFDSKTSTLDHFCLRVHQFDQKEMEVYFSSKGVEVLKAGPRKGAEGVGPSLYIKDPEGNIIELKGPPLTGRSTVTENSEITSKVKAVTTPGEFPTTDSTTHTNNANDDGASPNTSFLGHDDEGSQSMPQNGLDNIQQQVSLPFTPCVRICRYKDFFFNGRVCIGCFREQFEISGWDSFTDSERGDALLDAAERLAEYTEKEYGGGGAVKKEILLHQSKLWKGRQ
uniref:VOC domain-containing protein n=1 Tax=Heterosigma akashiwo TaxID=2829 RepID=A0A7S3YLX8_HETAK